MIVKTNSSAEWLLLRLDDITTAPRPVVALSVDPDLVPDGIHRQMEEEAARVARDRMYSRAQDIEDGIFYGPDMSDPLLEQVVKHPELIDMVHIHFRNSGRTGYVQLFPDTRFTSHDEPWVAAYPSKAYSCAGDPDTEVFIFEVLAEYRVIPDGAVPTVEEAKQYMLRHMWRGGSRDSGTGGGKNPLSKGLGEAEDPDWGGRR